MKLKHDRGIDIARAIGITLVVFGHAGFLWPIEKVIYSMHMPLFFILSGILSRESPIIETIIVKARTLLIPYLAAMAVSWIIFGPGPWGGIESWRSFGLDLLTAGQPNDILYNSPLWFLPCLWSVFVIESVVRTALSNNNRNSWVLLTIAAFLFTVFMQPITAAWPLRIPTALSCIPFFIIGKIVRVIMYDGCRQIDSKKRFFLLPRSYSSNLIYFIFFSLAWILFTKIDHNFYYVIAHNQYGYPLYFFIKGISGSLSLLLLIRYLTSAINNRYPFVLNSLSFISFHSIFIYLFHKPFIIHSSSLMHDSSFYHYFPKFIILSCVGLIIPIIFSSILINQAPRIHAVFVGGRVKYT